ncbi:MAG: protein kinase [Phycisphaerales bacterium]|nr:protein kinase [Phycisphaerales bacterium]
MSDSESHALPSEIAGYRIVSMLGEGGMSVVYAAMQSQPKRMVALKVLKGTSFPPSVLRRFKQEVEILGKLRHPGIAQVYDAGTWDDGSGAKPYFVMEHIPGGRELDVYLRERDATIEQRVRVFVRVCAAINHGHQRKIIHRDLKPGNILVDEQGEPKVIDYGVARASEVKIDQQTMHTEAGRLVGTVQYMAPEQVDMAMQDIDGRCDVYALGVVLYLILTGEMPHSFDGQPIFEAMRVIREDVPVGLRSLNSDIDRDLETIVLTCLEKERSRRYQDAGELGKDLVRYLKHEPISARRPSPLYRARKFIRRHRTLAIASVLVLLAALGSALVLVMSSGSIDAEDAAAMQAQLQQEQALRAQAESERDQAQAVVERDFRPQTPYVLRGLDSPVTHLAAADAMTLAGLTADSVAAWSLPDGRRKPAADTSGLKPGFISMSRDGRYMAVVGRREVSYVELETGRANRWDLSRRRPTAAALSLNGGLVAMGFEDLSLNLFTPDGRQLERVTSTSGAYSHLVFGPNNLLAGISDDRVTIWRYDGALKEIGRHNYGFLFSTPVDLMFTADGTSLLALSNDGVVASYNIEMSEEESINRAVGMGDPVSCSFDPDGTAVLVIEETTLYVIDLSTYELLTPPMPLPEPDVPYVLGPKASFIAHGSANGEITVIPLAPVAP